MIYLIFYKTNQSSPSRRTDNVHPGLGQLGAGPAAAHPQRGHPEDRGGQPVRPGRQRRLRQVRRPEPPAARAAPGRGQRPTAPAAGRAAAEIARLPRGQPGPAGVLRQPGRLAVRRHRARQHPLRADVRRRQIQRGTSLIFLFFPVNDWLFGLFFER